MKILIEEYNPYWPAMFSALETKLRLALREFEIAVEHIGSTSIPGLAAKPIIDIAVGVGSEDDFDKTVAPMLEHHFIYYQAFNALIPGRRLFVGLRDEKDFALFNSIYSDPEKIPHEAINLRRLCHVHVVKYGSDHWLRHLAFRDYLRHHAKDRVAYAKLKKELSLHPWQDGMEYNAAKESLLQEIEKKAILWRKRN